MASIINRVRALTGSNTSQTSPAQLLDFVQDAYTNALASSTKELLWPLAATITGTSSAGINLTNNSTIILNVERNSIEAKKADNIKNYAYSNTLSLEYPTALFPEYIIKNGGVLVKPAPTTAAKANVYIVDVQAASTSIVAGTSNLSLPEFNNVVINFAAAADASAIASYLRNKSVSAVNSLVTALNAAITQYVTNVPTWSAVTIGSLPTAPAGYVFPQVLSIPSATHLTAGYTFPQSLTFPASPTASFTFPQVLSFPSTTSTLDLYTFPQTITLPTAPDGYTFPQVLSFASSTQLTNNAGLAMPQTPSFPTGITRVLGGAISFVSGTNITVGYTMPQILGMPTTATGSMGISDVKAFTIPQTFTSPESPTTSFTVPQGQTFPTNVTGSFTFPVTIITPTTSTGAIGRASVTGYTTIGTSKLASVTTVLVNPAAAPDILSPSAGSIALSTSSIESAKSLVQGATITTNVKEWLDDEDPEMAGAVLGAVQAEIAIAKAKMEESNLTLNKQSKQLDQYITEVNAKLSAYKAQVEAVVSNSTQVREDYQAEVGLYKLEYDKLIEKARQYQQDYAVSIEKMKAHIQALASDANAYTADFQADIGRYQAQVAAEVQELGVYQADFERKLGQYKLEYDKVIEKAKQYQADYMSEVDMYKVNINKVVEENRTYIQMYSAELQEYQIDVDKEFKRLAQVTQDYKAELEYMQFDMQKQIESAKVHQGGLSVELQQYQIDTSKVFETAKQYVADYMSEQSTYQINVNKVLATAKQYSEDYQSTLGVYQVNVNKIIETAKMYQADYAVELQQWQVAVTNAFEAAKVYQQDYAVELNLYQADINKVLTNFQADIQNETSRFNGELQAAMGYLQRAQIELGKNQNAASFLNAAATSEQKGERFYSWALQELARLNQRADELNIVDRVIQSREQAKENRGGDR